MLVKEVAFYSMGSEEPLNILKTFPQGAGRAGETKSPKVEHTAMEKGGLHYMSISVFFLKSHLLKSSLLQTVSQQFPYNNRVV
jgi:hypothetical protein